MQSSSLLSSALLLLLAAATTTAAAAAAAADQDALQFSHGDVYSIPGPNDDAAAMVSFRLKETRPCECVNGGRCHARLRRCLCPLGYGGAHCEQPDVQLLTAVKQESSAASSMQQQQSELQRVRLVPVQSFHLADWLFYVPLLLAVLLLCTLVRIFVLLFKSYVIERKQLTLTVVAQQKPESEKSIYTMPLPVHHAPPPPYSEQAAGAFVCGAAAAAAASSAHFAHSTPFKSGSSSRSKGVVLIDEEPQYMTVAHLDDYTVIV